MMWSDLGLGCYCFVSVADLDHLGKSTVDSMLSNDDTVGLWSWLHSPSEAICSSFDLFQRFLTHGLDWYWRIGLGYCCLEVWSCSEQLWLDSSLASAWKRQTKCSCLVRFSTNASTLLSACWSILHLASHVCVAKLNLESMNLTAHSKTHPAIQV